MESSHSSVSSSSSSTNFKSAKFIVQYKNRFTVCHNHRELYLCNDYRWKSSTTFNNTKYRINDDGNLNIKGKVDEFKWIYNIPYFENGKGPEGMESYVGYTEHIKRKYWLWGEIISTTMDAKFKKSIPHDLITSNFELIERDYNKWY